MSTMVTPLGCPIDILSAIEIFASQRRIDSVIPSYTMSAHALDETLQSIKSYDVAAWAEAFRVSDPTVPFYDLLQLGTIWKLAAEVYAYSILRNITSGYMTTAGPPSADKIIKEYAYFRRKDDEFVKCLIWPTFVTGAISNSQENRDLILQELDRIWHIGHCANTKNAAKILKSLWRRHDQRASAFSPIRAISTIGFSQSADSEWFDWDWIHELSQLNDSWLFV